MTTNIMMNNDTNNHPADMEKRTSETPTEPLDLSDDEAIEALFGTLSTKPQAQETEETTDGKKKKKNHAGGIKFGEVRVREHELVLDRRSSEANGLGIGWAHRSSVHYVLDDFEKKKVDEHHNEGALKTKTKHYERFQKLVNYGYSTKEVLEQEKERQKAKERRDKGLPDLPSTRSKNKNRTNRSLSPVRIVKNIVSGFGNNNESGNDSASRKTTTNGRSRSPPMANGRSRSPKKTANGRSRSPVRLVTGLVPGLGKKNEAPTAA